MSAELHWFPVFVADWLTSDAITLMLPEQEGAFFRLLLRAWGKGVLEPCLPDDDAKLATLSRLGKRWAKLGPLVREQFEARDGALYNAKLSAVWEEQQHKHCSAVERGKLGARTRTANLKQGPSSAQAEPKQLEREGEEARATTPAAPRKAVVVRTARTDRPSSGPAFALAPYVVAYSERFPGANVPTGEMGRVLKPLEARHGPVETLARFRRWLPVKGQLGVTWFGKTWSDWGELPATSNGARPSRVLAATEMILE